jgi:hypothetical protein
VEELNKGMLSGAKMMFKVEVREESHVRNIQSGVSHVLPEEYREGEQVTWTRFDSSY